MMDYIKTQATSDEAGVPSIGPIIILALTLVAIVLFCCYCIYFS